jgi:hypothetical protein
MIIKLENICNWLQNKGTVIIEDSKLFGCTFLILVILKIISIYIF